MVGDRGFDGLNGIVAPLDKLVRRHPHVFGETAVSGAEEVKEYYARSRSVFPDQRNEVRALFSGAATVVVEFDLTGMDDEIAILSGRPDTAALMEQIAPPK